MTATAVAVCEHDIFPRGGQGWRADSQVIYGSLPPGITYHDASGFTGVPEVPGHYFAKIRFTNVTCAGYQKDDEDVDVHFDITGDTPRQIP